MSAKKYLILAEGYSHDPHYGKTMYGVLRYRRNDVVAILPEGVGAHGAATAHAIADGLAESAAALGAEQSVGLRPDTVRGALGMREGGGGKRGLSPAQCGDRLRRVPRLQQLVVRLGELVRRAIELDLLQRP